MAGRKLSYFEMKHRLEELLVQGGGCKDKINLNKRFIEYMEASTIELMRKVTFKIKVLDQVSLQLVDGYTPQLDGAYTPSPGEENNNMSQEFNHSVLPQTKEIVIDLLKNKKITVPSAQHLLLSDVIIVGNQGLLDMVNIFEDNYWIQPEKVE